MQETPKSNPDSGELGSHCVIQGLPHESGSPSASSVAADQLPFTIAIPTFNRADWLRTCVASALSQTYRNFEVVVSDNASSDSTPEVLREFDDPRLRVIRQDRNIGPVPNWNACLKASKGAFVVFVCDDDRVAPNLLARCAALIRSEPDIPVVVALGDVFAPADGYRRAAVASRMLTTGIWDGTEILKEFLKDRISPQMCTVAMRAQTLRARGGFPSGWPHTGDLASWVPLLLLGRAGLVNESCGTYYNHGGTQTSRFPLALRLADIRRLADLITATADRHAVDPRTREEIKFLAQRYLSRHVVGNIAASRGSGATFAEVLPLMWAWRSQLRHAGVMRDIGAWWRPLALLLLPSPLTRGAKSVLKRLGSRRLG